VPPRLPARGASARAPSSRVCALRLDKTGRERAAQQRRAAPSLSVGAAGFEPTTPSPPGQKKRSTAREERGNTSPTTPLAPLDVPRSAVCNEMCNDEGSLRERIAAAIVAGDDARAARLMTLLRATRLRVVGWRLDRPRSFRLIIAQRGERCRQP
jgi:hypothetical protein